MRLLPALRFALPFLIVPVVFGQNDLAKEAFNKGVNAQNRNDFDSAVLYYTKAIELAPKYAPAYYNRGIVFNSQKKYAEAIGDYTKAIELDPKYAKAYNNRGNAFQAIGKKKEAAADFAKAKSLGLQ